MLTAEWKSQAHMWWARTTRSNTLHPANLHSLLLWSSFPPQPVPQCRGSFRPTNTPARNFGLQQLLLTLLVWRLKSFAGTRVQGDDPGRWIFQRQQRSKAAIGHRRSIPSCLTKFWPLKGLGSWMVWYFACWKFKTTVIHGTGSKLSESMLKNRTPGKIPPGKAFSSW